jgi:DNA polymerase III alpha subunit
LITISGNKNSSPSHATNTPLVAAHDVYYLKPEDRIARETMIKIQSGGVVDTSGDGHGEDNFSFLTQADIIERFKDTLMRLKTP